MVSDTGNTFFRFNTIHSNAKSKHIEKVAMFSLWIVQEKLGLFVPSTASFLIVVVLAGTKISVLQKSVAQ